MIEFKFDDIELHNDATQLAMLYSEMKVAQEARRENLGAITRNFTSSTDEYLKSDRHLKARKKGFFNAADKLLKQAEDYNKDLLEGLTQAERIFAKEDLKQGLEDLVYRRAYGKNLAKPTDYSDSYFPEEKQLGR